MKNNKKNLWIIPCKYSRSIPVVFNITLLRNAHPEDDICVVDSNSDDQSYKFEVNDKINFFLTGNSNRAWGAFVKAINEIDYKNYNRICFIHDSITVHRNMNEIFGKSDFMSFKWFMSSAIHLGGFYTPGGTGMGFDNNESRDWAIRKTTEIGIEWPSDEQFYGLFGIIMFMKPKVVTELVEIGVTKIVPETKIQCCGTERILGFILKNKLGYDFVKHSILGDFFNNQFSNEYISKVVTANR